MNVTTIASASHISYSGSEHISSPAIRRVFSYELEPNSNSQVEMDKITSFLEKNKDIIKAFNPPKLIEEGRDRKISISLSCLGSTDVVRNRMQYDLGLGDYGLFDHFSRFPSCEIEKKLELPPRLANEASLEGLLCSIFSNENMRYLIVGECHLELAAETFLTKYKEMLAENGFEILGKEFYCTLQQPHLDAYHFEMTEKVPQGSISPLMDLMGVSERHPIVEEFHKVGIRTIALEDRNVINIHAEHPSRISAFDDCAYQAINKEVMHRQKKGKTLSRNAKGKGKVILHVGAAHAEGIAKRLGRSQCVTIGARDIPIGQPSFEHNGKINHLVFDLLIKTPVKGINEI